MIEMPDTQTQAQKQAAREAKREEYRPKNGVKCLFIAESPPRDNERFFYFENVSTHDWLYKAVMEVVFPEVFKDMDNKEKSKELRSKKREYLTRFCNEGYFLIDAVDDPFEDKSKTNKRRIIKAQKDKLLEKILDIKPQQNRSLTIILISKNVFEILTEFLRDSKISVINNSLIPFPSNGNQNKSKRIIEKLLRDNHIL